MVVPVQLAQQVVDRALEHEAWEEFSRMKLAQGGELRKYYPLNEQGRQEYEDWRCSQQNGR